MLKSCPALGVASENACSFSFLSGEKNRPMRPGVKFRRHLDKWPLEETGVNSLDYKSLVKSPWSTYWSTNTDQGAPMGSLPTQTPTVSALELEELELSHGPAPKTYPKEKNCEVLY